MGRNKLVEGRLLLLQSSLCLPSFSSPSPCITFSFRRSLSPPLLLSLLKSEQYLLRLKNERQPLQQQSRTEPLLAAPLTTLTLSPASLSLSRQQALSGSSRHSHALRPFQVEHSLRLPPRRHVHSLPFRSTARICLTISLQTCWASCSIRLSSRKP